MSAQAEEQDRRDSNTNGRRHVVSLRRAHDPRLLCCCFFFFFSLDLVSIRERLIHRYFVHIFEIASHRHTHRNARYVQAERFQ
jgi:hypothetical protein